MGKAGKVIKGWAVNVKYLDQGDLDRGSRRIVKTLVSPMVCQTDQALATFIQEQKRLCQKSGVTPEFEIFEATMHLGKKTQVKEELLKSLTNTRPGAAHAAL